MGKTFVGIGLGAIQSGLFLLEAQASGNFDRLVVAEVVPGLVAGIRASGGTCWINVAQRRGIRHEKVAELEIYNPLDPDDAAQLVSAVAEASEIATALPSVDFYGRGELSPAQLLARGIARKLDDRKLPRAIIYAAENHNQAARQLRDHVLANLDAGRANLDESVQFVDTVIGKMSGVVPHSQHSHQDHLAPLYAGSSHAVLVEEFNRIYIQQVALNDFRRGITVFVERPNLLPYEEAKLYGHNAAHALLGFLANRQGLEFAHQASVGLLAFVREAFVNESGVPLSKRYAAIDPLFTPTGWNKYVDDLLTRMTNPYLQDRVDRIIRDPRRKLGWDDRLVGAMRLAIDNKIEPRRYTLAAAMAVRFLINEDPTKSVEECLLASWGDRVTRSESSPISSMIVDRLREIESAALSTILQATL